MLRSLGSLFSPASASNLVDNNSGVVGDVGTLNSNTTTGSYNTIVHGVAGQAAAVLGGVFYAYMHNISDDNTSRYVLVFGSRRMADEWWRAVSTSNINILQGNIKRVTPQFYTHDDRKWGFQGFFTDDRVASISQQFRGKMFFVLENDRVGRGISIIPTQSIVDHCSGDWFTIRSKANAHHYWYYSEKLGCITISETRRTSFKISAQNMDDGAIMIGADSITLVVQHHGFVVPHTPNAQSSTEVLGVTTTQSEAFKFKFDDLEKGHFVLGGETLPSTLCYMPQGGVSPGWELAL